MANRQNHPENRNINPSNKSKFLKAGVDIEMSDTTTKTISQRVMSAESKKASIQFFLCCFTEFRTDKSREFTTSVSTSSVFKVWFSVIRSPFSSSVTVIPRTSAMGINNVTFGMLAPLSLS